jgi:hypothetical protein
MAHSVILTWVASTDPVDGYNLYRSIVAGAEAGPPINGATPVTETTFTDTSVVDGDFFYVARSVKGGVESVNSNEAEAKILPAAPSGLTATGA